MKRQWLPIAAGLLCLCAAHPAASASELKVGEIIWLEKDTQGESQPRVPSLYRPGEEAGVMLDLSGYATDAKGWYQLRLDLKLSDAKGAVLFRVPGKLLKEKADADRGKMYQQFFVSIPAYMPAGTFKMRIQVTDEVAKKLTAISGEFSVQRDQPLIPTRTLTARELIFSKAKDGPPLKPVSYQAGETLRYRFEIAGMQFRADKPDLRVGVKWITASGEVAFEDSSLFEFQDQLDYHPNTIFFPVAGFFNIPDDFPPGKHRLELTVTDRHAQKSVTLGGDFALKTEAAGAGLRLQRCQLLESKGGPVRVAAPYQLMDKIYLSCDVVGYAVDAQQQMNVSARMTLTDPAGLTVMEPKDIEFKDKLAGASRPPLINSFALTLPAYAPGGAYKITFAAKDQNSGQSVSMVVPFDMKRAMPPALAPALTVRSFAYAGEKNGPLRTPPRFKGGEAVHYRFEIAGFKFRGDQTDINVNLRLLGPDGAVLMDRPDFADMKESYIYRTPAVYVPFTGTFTIPAEVGGGAYTIDMVVTDRIAQKSATYKSSFQIAGAPASGKPAKAPAPADKGPGLVVSASNGDTARVKSLLTAGADPDAPHGDEKLTALMMSAQNGHLDIVRALIAARASVNAKATDGNSALMLATGNNHLEIVRALLAAKADPETKMSNDGWTPLIVAGQKGHTEIAKALLAAGANVDASLANGWGALLLAAQNGHAAVTGVLIAARANVNLPSSDGWAPLTIAAQNGHLDVVRALLAAKAKVNAQSPANGVTALFMASQNGHTEVVRALLAAKANPALKLNSGATPLVIAKQRNHMQIVALLEKSGASGPSGAIQSASANSAPAARTITWGDSAASLGLRAGEPASLNCPAGGAAATVYGTGLYTDDSSICTAAVHAGLVSFERGGGVKVQREPGASTYQSSARNGVTSRDYGNWGGSFRVSK